MIPFTVRQTEERLAGRLKSKEGLNWIGFRDQGSDDE